MSFAEFRAEAREAGALDRLRPRLKRESDEAIARANGRLWRSRFWDVVLVTLKWAFPGILLLLPPTGSDSMWLFWSIVVIGGMPGQLAKVDVKLRPFEALHMPSRRGLLVARFRRRLPWALWVGACGVGFSLRKLEAAPESSPWPWAAYLAIIFAPTLHALYCAWDAKQIDAATNRACNVAWLSVAATASTTVAAGLGGQYVSGLRDGVAAPVVSTAVACLLWWALAAAAKAASREGVRDVSAGYVAARVAAQLGMFAWLAALFVWAKAPQRVAPAIVGRFGTAAGIAGLAVTFCAGWFFVAQQVRLIQTAEVLPSDRNDKSDDGPATAAVESGELRRARPGIGLWRAQWRLFHEHHPFRGMAAVGTWMRLAAYAVPPALAVCAVLQSEQGVCWWLVVPVLIAPRLVAIDDKHADRLHHYGVGFREQKLHNLRALFFVAMPPTILATATAGTLAGWTDFRVAAFCALVAGFLLRCGRYGLDADELIPGLPTRVGCPLVMVVWSASLAAPYVLVHQFGMSEPAADWPTIAAVALLGILSLVGGPWKRDEDWTRDVARLVREPDDAA